MLCKFSWWAGCYLGRNAARGAMGAAVYLFGHPGWLQLFDCSPMTMETVNELARCMVY